MSNFKKFLEVQKINRQIRHLERGMFEEVSDYNPWSTALGFSAYRQPAVARRTSEKEVLYRRSINKLVEQRETLKAN